MTVSAAAESGDRRKTLEALRDKLAAAVDSDEADPRTLPALSKELASVVRELDSLPGGEKVDEVDEIAERRRKRLAAAAGQ
jgi:hypothetical protein